MPTAIIALLDIRVKCCLTKILSDGIIENRFHGHDVKTVFSACPESFAADFSGRAVLRRRPDFIFQFGQRRSFALPHLVGREWRLRNGGRAQAQQV